MRGVFFWHILALSSAWGRRRPWRITCVLAWFWHFVCGRGRSFRMWDVCVCVIFWQAPGPRSEIEMPTANLPNYFLVDSALGKSCPSYSAQDEPIIRLSCTDARGNRKKSTLMNTQIAGAHNECLSPHSDGSIGIYHCFPSNIASFGYVCVYQYIPYAGMPWFQEKRL